MARSQAIDTRLEKLIPCTEELFVNGVITSEDMRTMVRERTSHEYKLVARPLLLLDLRNAIEFELGIEKKIATFCNQKRFNDGDKPIRVNLRHRWAIQDRIEQIYRIGLKHLHRQRKIADPALLKRTCTLLDASKNLVDDFEEFRQECVHQLKIFGRKAALGKLYAQWLTLCPHDVFLWSEAARFEAEGGQFDEARSVILQSISQLSESSTTEEKKEVWGTAVMIELCFSKKLMENFISEAVNRKEANPASALRGENAALASVVLDLALVKAVLEEALMRAGNTILSSFFVSLLFKFQFTAGLIREVLKKTRVAENSEDCAVEFIHDIFLSTVRCEENNNVSAETFICEKVEVETTKMLGAQTDTEWSIRSYDRRKSLTQHKNKQNIINSIVACISLGVAMSKKKFSFLQSAVCDRCGNYPQELGRKLFLKVAQRLIEMRINSDTFLFSSEERSNICRVCFFEFEEDAGWRCLRELTDKALEEKGLPNSEKNTESLLFFVLEVFGVQSTEFFDTPVIEHNDSGAHWFSSYIEDSFFERNMKLTDLGALTTFRTSKDSGLELLAKCALFKGGECSGLLQAICDNLKTYSKNSWRYITAAQLVFALSAKSTNDANSDSDEPKKKKTRSECGMHGVLEQMLRLFDSSLQSPFYSSALSFISLSSTSVVDESARVTRTKAFIAVVVVQIVATLGDGEHVANLLSHIFNEDDFLEFAMSTVKELTPSKAGQTTLVNILTVAEKSIIPLPRYLIREVLFPIARRSGLHSHARNFLGILTDLFHGSSANAILHKKATFAPLLCGERPLSAEQIQKWQCEDWFLRIQFEESDCKNLTTGKNLRSQALRNVENPQYLLSLFNTNS